MKPLVVAFAGVVLIMTAACGGGSPALPTAVGPSSSAISVSGPAPAAQSIGGTTTWSCFAGSSAGIFASAGCARPITIGALAVHAAAVPGAPPAPSGLQSGVSDRRRQAVASLLPKRS